jgi:hypothetical protein
MEYLIALLKHQGDGLLAVIISDIEEEQAAAIKQNPTWEILQTGKLTADTPYPSAICNQLLITEETSDRLYRSIIDTWIGPIEDDPLDNYAEYSAREEAKNSLDKAYLDRLEED